MGERRGTKGLELWCRRMTEGYPGVEVNNMTTSWRDGLAFCAIIHHFRPDLIDFAKLNKNDIYYNNDLAFQVAERHLGIPALLEPEDMVEFAVPDRLSILTYLSQFYQTFVVAQGSPSRLVPKRPSNTPDRGVVSPTSTSPTPKIPRPSGGVGRREPCAKCGLPVFIAERLNVGKQLYHRTCFRCARCNSQLTLANYYETETQSQFCCETCPDEEQANTEDPDNSSLSEKMALSRSLSDEEKSAGLLKFGEQDDYSASFESALEQPEDKGLSLSGEQSALFVQARSLFITSQLVKSDSEDEAPDLPKSEPPSLPKNEPPDVDELEHAPYSEILETINPSIDLHESLSSIVNNSTQYDSGYPSNAQSLDAVVNSSANVSDVTSRNQPQTANNQLDIDESVTKDDTFSDNGTTGTSLVKLRMSMFENKANEIKIISPSKPIPQKVPLEEEQLVTGLNSSEICDTSVISISSQSSSAFSPSTDEQSIIVLSDSVDVSVKTEIEQDKVIEIFDSTVETDKSADKTEEDYPEGLNPFGDDDEQQPIDSRELPVSLNPFDGDEDEEDLDKPSPKPAVRKKLKVRPSDFRDNDTLDDSSLSHLNNTSVKHETYNPFESSVVYTQRVVPAPKISLNPFWTDGEPDDEENEIQRPVPLPRHSRGSIDTPEPKPRKSGLSLSSGLSASNFGSNTSLSSAHSSLGPAARRKKQAPKPPSKMDKPDSAQSSLASSPSASAQHSPRLTPRVRKSKKAPPPPSTASTPAVLAKNIDFSDVSPIPLEQTKTCNSEPGEWEKEKIIKDELNRNRQSQAVTSPISSSENTASLTTPNKSMFGQWKRRKGPAPSRPIPQRRSIKPLPVGEIKRELEFIEIQQQGLEKQGVRLEQIIREKCEGPNVDVVASSLAPETEDLILQLFELVNEKNELFRKQAELMYLRRQQRLEEEYADLEYQIRCLMLQPEANKTDCDKEREEELINRLVEVVERRNEIVECLEMDRVREAEEDDSINSQLNLYASRREEDSTVKPNPAEPKQKKKIKKKLKLKSSKKVDVDKDIDESESSSSSLQVKDKKKKKFNIF